MSQALVNLLPKAKHVPAAQRLLTPKTNAIPLFNTDLAHYYSYAHTLQLLVYYYLRGSALVRDPLSTMLQDLFPVAVSQCLFCAICLPRVGKWNSGTTDGEMIRGSASATKGPALQKKKLGAPVVKGAAKTAPVSEGARDKDPGGSWPSRILVSHDLQMSACRRMLTVLQPTTLALILSLMIPPVPLMVLALVLGAPLYPTYLLPHTMALAAHVSLLGTLPIFYTHGVSTAAWRDVSAAWLPFDEAGVWGGAVGAMVGGWFGAIPIALDWDREWQKWPCTVLWGAVLGWGIGRLVTNLLRLGVGRRIDLSVTETLPPSGAEREKIELKKDD